VHHEVILPITAGASIWDLAQVPVPNSTACGASDVIIKVLGE
jgi:hypothetical protein